MARIQKRNHPIIWRKGLYLYVSVLAYDPGSYKLGWSYLTSLMFSDELIFLKMSYGCFKFKGDIYKRLGVMRSILKPPRVDWALVESPFVNKNWSTSLVLSYSRGVVMSILSEISSLQLDFASNKIKTFFSGKTKEDLRDFLMEELRMPRVSLDESDAMGMALVFFSERILNQRKFLGASQYLRVIDFH